jgi:anti-anti-sigma factor
VNTTQDREADLLAGTTVVISCTALETDLARRLADSLRLGARHVVVELGDAPTVDSSTLASLTRVAGRLGARGGRLSVVCEHPNLASLLHVTLLDHSFSVFDSLDAALRAT